MNVAVLSTFNLDLIPPFIMEALERRGHYTRVYVGGFGQLAQEVLAEDSQLYRAKPDAVVLVPAVEDLLAPLFERPAVYSPSQSEELVRDRVEELAALTETILERLPASTCYVVVFGTDAAPMQHILSPRAAHRGQAAVEELLDGVRSLGELSPRVVVVDWDWHVRTHGVATFRDNRLWYLGRMRLNPAGLAALAELVATHVAAYRGLAYKVLVVDLDDTLWGGVVGEDGLRGIVLGEEGVGLAFQDFQRELLRLYDSGVVLAICSKNNPQDAWEVFEKHPAMVVAPEHFAATRINWQDKATNLGEISDELGLGLGSFVFLDDSRVEREWVRKALPQVLVPDLPQDPACRPEFLHTSDYFQRISLTDADLVRAQSYKARSLRSHQRERTASMEEFLSSLEQDITMDAVHEGSLARAAQMSQRTNQFNLTTRRYTIADLERMGLDDSIEMYTLAVRDRFGDSGITGLGILRFNGESAEIDTFLMSCRVLGRKVEDVLLAFLARRAGARKARYLIGNYVPTAKNGQVASLYPRYGFHEIGDGSFRLDLNSHRPEYPSQVSVRGRTGA